MAIPFSKRVYAGEYYSWFRWKLGYYLFFLFQSFHIFGFYLLNSGEPDASLLFISGIINIFLYTKLLFFDIQYGQDDINPLWFYLGMSILRLGLAVLYVAAVVWTGDFWVIRLGRFDTRMWLMDGHILLLIGDLFFIAGYFFTKNTFRRKNIRNQIHNKYAVSAIFVYRSGFIMTIIGFGMRVLESIISLGGLGQIVGYITDYGVPAGLFLMIDSCRYRKLSLISPDVVIVVALLLFSVLSGLSSYMKSDLLISLFPFIFLVIGLGLRRLNTSSQLLKARFKYIFIIGVLFYFFMFTVSAYSELRRQGFWENMSSYDLKITDEMAPAVLPDFIIAVKGSMPWTNEFVELQHYPDGGVWHLLNRLSVTSWAATSIALVEISGTRQDSMIGAILLSITPRVIYPDKPHISWGSEVAVELGQARSIETATTATGLTMAGFLYWWGGSLNVLIMAFLSGAGFAFIFILFSRDWRFNPISALVIMVMTYDSFHWKEDNVLGGFPYYLYMLSVFLLLSKLFRKLFLKNYNNRIKYN